MYRWTSSFRVLHLAAVLAFLVSLVLVTLFLAVLTPDAYNLPTAFASIPLPWKISNRLSSLSNFSSLLPMLPSIFPPDSLPGGPIYLGVATRVYVVSLSRRTDRRLQMDTLARALSLDLTYINATDKNEWEVSAIFNRVSSLRKHLATVAQAGRGLNGLGFELPELSMYAFRNATFDWPEDLKWTDETDGAELWTRSPSSEDLHSEVAHRETCATGNHLYPLKKRSPRPFEVLDLPKIACWHSHFGVIRDIAQQRDDSGVAIVLEDDVDMEQDTIERLQALWGALPEDWDVVYLGHCWSNERKHAPLRVVAPPFDRQPASKRNQSALHPAFEPKCTHAYALSVRGARRLRAHLRFPPFAYSRAIDQALSWLVRSGRINAFSVVPPLVVQRKVGESDLMPGRGSQWKDTLYNSALARIHRNAKHQALEMTQEGTAGNPGVQK